MFTQMMVDIHANVSTNQLEDYLQYVKQKKKRSKTWRQGRPWNQARSDMKEEWGMACEGSELSVCVCVVCVCEVCVCMGVNKVWCIHSSLPWLELQALPNQNIHWLHCIHCNAWIATPFREC